MEKFDTLKTIDATLINECIESMLSNLKIDDVDNDEISCCGYNTDYYVIKGTFGRDNNSCLTELNKLDIYRQLVLIDSLYSTNVKRMRQFGLEEICDEIWRLCDNGSGKHNLANLTSKLDTSKQLPLNVSTIFSKQFGYISGCKSSSAPSLISKYFFFASAQCPLKDNMGFPIYDTIVCDLLYKVQKCLNIPLTPRKCYANGTLNIDVYIDGLRRIINVLEANNPILWNNSNLTKFQILDYFLWNIGKAGKKSYNLLFTKQEMKDYYAYGMLPARIIYWEQIYSSL